jgi:hypothetical protein
MEALRMEKAPHRLGRGARHGAASVDQQHSPVRPRTVRLGVRPAPIPPVYDPAVVADAIVFAAMHPRRDIHLGAARPDNSTCSSA